MDIAGATCLDYLITHASHLFFGATPYPARNSVRVKLGICYRARVRLLCIIEPHLKPFSLFTKNTPYQVSLLTTGSYQLNSYGVRVRRGIQMVTGRESTLQLELWPHRSYQSNSYDKLLLKKFCDLVHIHQQYCMVVHCNKIFLYSSLCTFAIQTYDNLNRSINCSQQSSKNGYSFSKASSTTASSSLVAALLYM